MGLQDTDEHVYNEPNYLPHARVKQLVKPIKYVVVGECWVCISHARADHRGGYPVINRNGKWYRMSRYIYECEHGSLSDELFVMHTCDNPTCINPSHLAAGTPLENTRDMVEKGRKPVGEAVPCAKLANSDVLDIRKDSRSSAVIARDYGVSKKTIQDVRKRRTWKHI